MDNAVFYKSNILLDILSCRAANRSKNCSCHWSTLFKHQKYFMHVNVIIHSYQPFVSLPVSMSLFITEATKSYITNYLPPELIPIRTCAYAAESLKSGVQSVHKPNRCCIELMQFYNVVISIIHRIQNFPRKFWHYSPTNLLLLLCYVWRRIICCWCYVLPTNFFWYYVSLTIFCWQLLLLVLIISYYC